MDESGVSFGQSGTQLGQQQMGLGGLTQPQQQQQQQQQGLPAFPTSLLGQPPSYEPQQPGRVTIATSTAGVGIGQGGLQIGQGLGQGQGLQLGQGIGSGLQQGGLQLGQQGQGLQGLGSGLLQGGLQLGQGLQQGQRSQSGLWGGQGLGSGPQQGGLQLGQGLQQGQGGLQLGQGLGQGLASTSANPMTLPSGLASGTSVLSGLPGTQTTTTGQATTSVTLQTGGGTSQPEAGTAGTTSSQAGGKGLGGVDQSYATGGASNTSNIVKSVYEEPLADVLQQLVAEFAKFMKQQRDVGDEINRHNDSAIKKVRQEIDTHCQNLAAISAKIQDEAQMIGFLKQQTSEELKNSEVAQRTRDMPSSLQYDNTAPDEYFRRMIAKFEEKMELFSNQIDELQSHLNVGGGASLTPQNLIDILQLQYKPFLVLASQLQTLHEQVESLKEQYLTYRYVFLQDTTDVFDERRKRTKLESASQQVKRGPPPFSSVMGQATAALAAATSQDSTQDRTSGNPGNFQLSSLTSFPVSLGQNTLGFGGLPLGGGGAGGLSLNLSSQTAGAAVGQAGTFNLQKPPAGKRKH
ncbi:hypothetical protein EMCRGX_G028715 [Ephydatia muelleri]